jgi:hypothetical protein
MKGKIISFAKRLVMVAKREREREGNQQSLPSGGG